MEDLVLTKDSALEATRDGDEVACGGGVFEPEPSGGKLGERAVAERAQGYVQLDPVAGVYQDDSVMGRKSFALRSKRLAGGARHPSGVSDQSQHGGCRRLAHGGCRCLVRKVRAHRGG